MNIKKYFAGRIGRLEYFTKIVISSIAIGVVSSIILATRDTIGIDSLTIALNILTILLLFVFGVFVFSLHISRFHDLGKSGFYCLLSFIPGLNIILFFYLFLAKGQKEVNKYGAPKVK